MRKTFFILSLAIIQFIVNRAVFFMMFAMGMSRFDAGGPPTLLERVFVAANSVLQFPLVTLALSVPRPFPKWFYGPVEYAPFVLNSFLWAIGIYFLVTLLKKAVRNRREILISA